MLIFSASFVAQFHPKSPEHLRYGQEFHQWACLDKIQGEDKVWCDKLYQMTEPDAIKAIASRTDYSQ